MDPALIGIIGLIVLCVLLLLGIHVGIVLTVVGIGGIWAIVGFEQAVSLAITTIYSQATQDIMVIIPLFVLMGLLAAEGGISSDLYRVMSYWSGRFRAGPGIATVLACALFGTISGSGTVTATVFSKISAPEMRKHGYDKKMAYAICASAGSLGLFIPPSLFMVLWAMLTDENPAKLLVGGVGPGILLIIFFSLTIIVMGRLKPHWLGSTPPPVSWGTKLASLKLLWHIVVVVAIMSLGLVWAVFSPVEASAVATIAVLIMTSFMMRGQRWERIKLGLLETATCTSMLFLILCGAIVTSRFLAISTITPRLLSYIMSLNLSAQSFILAIVLLYIFLGIWLDGIPIVAMTLPVIYPVVKAMHIDPMWFAMVAIVACQMAGITWPLGNFVFGAKSVAEPDVSVDDIFIGSTPFLFAWTAVIIILLLVPWTATFFPSLVK
jgi:C4-dicarboxylate transporter DctM subunit